MFILKLDGIFVTKRKIKIWSQQQNLNDYKCINALNIIGAIEADIGNIM